MIMSCFYYPATGELGQVASHWVGRPGSDKVVVYALFARGGDIAQGERWYIYTTIRDAVSVKPEKLPEAVRLAHMLLT
jgi:hypothetical protein